MELIDKEKVVTKIKTLRERAYELYGCSQFDTAYNNVLDSIATLEVKKVDLEKEIDTLWCSLFTNNTMKRDPTNPHTFIPDPAYTKDGAKIAYTLEIDWKIDEIDIDADFLMKFARHFFELGLKTKKGGRE